MKPFIGITPDTDDGRYIKTRSPDEKVVYLWDRYLRAFTDNGAVAVVLPVAPKPALIKGLLDRLDGVVLAGGNFDIHPRHYREKPIPELGWVKEPRTNFELALLREALKRDIPVLGICGGMQAINIVFGGTLYQDIDTQRPSSRNHQQKLPKSRPSHPVTVETGTRLARIVSGKRSAPETTIKVNSTHHQAVKDLGQGLVACGVASDGIVEAIESPDHGFVLGVQWHPEMLCPKYPEQQNIIRAFIRECTR